MGDELPRGWVEIEHRDGSGMIVRASSVEMVSLDDDRGTAIILSSGVIMPVAGERIEVARAIARAEEFDA